MGGEGRGGKLPLHNWPEGKTKLAARCAVRCCYTVPRLAGHRGGGEGGGIRGGTAKARAWARAFAYLPGGHPPDPAGASTKSEGFRCRLPGANRLGTALRVVMVPVRVLR